MSDVIMWKSHLLSPVKPLWNIYIYTGESLILDRIQYVTSCKKAADWQKAGIHADSESCERREWLMGFLPVAAASGSLPWRSASSHWYKAMDEPHAEKHGAKNKEKRGQCQNKCTQKSKLINVWEWVKHERHISYQYHKRAWHLRHNTHGL